MSELADWHVKSVQKRIRSARRSRAIYCAAVAIQSAVVTINLIAGRHLAALIFSLVVVVNVVNAVLQSRILSRLRLEEATALHEARPRPDYAAIARMELEVWGRTFDHAGAPDQGRVRLRLVTWDEDGERYCHEHQREHGEGGW